MRRICIVDIANCFRNLFLYDSVLKYNIKLKEILLDSQETTALRFDRSLTISNYDLKVK
jgi:hypothetical protein